MMMFLCGMLSTLSGVILMTMECGPPPASFGWAAAFAVAALVAGWQASKA